MRTSRRLLFILVVAEGIAYPLSIYKIATFILYEPEPVCHYSKSDVFAYALELACSSPFALSITIFWGLSVIYLIWKSVCGIINWVQNDRHFVHL